MGPWTAGNGNRQSHIMSVYDLATVSSRRTHTQRQGQDVRIKSSLPEPRVYIYNG